MIAKVAFMIIILSKPGLGVQMEVVEFKDMASCQRAAPIVKKNAFPMRIARPRVDVTCIEK